MPPIPATGARLLPYEAAPSLGFGVEVIFNQAVDIQRLFEDLQWIIAGTEQLAVPDFFVIDAAAPLTLVELRRLAQVSADRGLAEKVCVVVPLQARPLDAVLSELKNLGVRVLIGGVGVDARFSDLTESYADGIVFDRELIAAASGDPQAAAVLEAASSLATNLGLRTFANRCWRSSEIDVARSCGVNYLSLDRPATIGDLPATAASSRVLSMLRTEAR